VTVHMGSFTLGSFHLLYGACALLMIPCLFSARLVTDRRGDQHAVPPSANSAFNF